MLKHQYFLLTSPPRSSINRPLRTTARKGKKSKGGETTDEEGIRTGTRPFARRFFLVRRLRQARGEEARACARSGSRSGSRSSGEEVGTLEKLGCQKNRAFTHECPVFYLRPFEKDPSAALPLSFVVQRTSQYASLLMTSGALQLDFLKGPKEKDRLLNHVHLLRSPCPRRSTYDPVRLRTSGYRRPRI